MPLVAPVLQSGTTRRPFAFRDRAGHDSAPKPPASARRYWTGERIGRTARRRCRGDSRQRDPIHGRGSRPRGGPVRGPQGNGPELVRKAGATGRRDGDVYRLNGSKMRPVPRRSAGEASPDALGRLRARLRPSRARPVVALRVDQPFQGKPGPRPQAAASPGRTEGTGGQGRRRTFPLARTLPSTASAATGASPTALFGSFFGTTPRSDFPRPWLIVVRPKASRCALRQGSPEPPQQGAGSPGSHSFTIHCRF